MRAKCVIWIIIWIAHFELCSVHTREVIAIFELHSVHTRDRIWDFAFQWEKNVWAPCQSNMHGACISCASVNMQHVVFIRWFRCVICEMRNLKTPPDRHLKCAFQMTHRDVILCTHSPKYHLLNCNSKCAFQIKIEITHFALVRKQSMWPCIIKPTNSLTAQFYAMAKNMSSGSACVILRFLYILKEQFFFYIILKFGSIKRIISSGFCCFSKAVFFGLILFAIIACVLWFPYNLDYLAHFELQQLLNGAS